MPQLVGVEGAELVEGGLQVGVLCASFIAVFGHGRLLICGLICGLFEITGDVTSDIACGGLEFDGAGGGEGVVR